MDARSSSGRKYAHTRAGALYEELCRLAAQLRPGTPFPSENALARKYRVSRTTAHKVMQWLESDGAVICRRGVGAFVSGRRTVTMLLPCPDYMTDDYQPRNDVFMLHFQGAMKAARDLGLSLKTLPVAPFNNPDFNLCGIDYEQFSEIGPDSLVVCSEYFCKLYPLLQSRGAKAAVMGYQYEHYGYRHYHNEFYTVDADLRGAVRRILDHCLAAGHRRIALVKCNVAEKKYPLNNAYSKWCAEHDMPELFYSFPDEDGQSDVFSEGLISNLYGEIHFDALIFQHSGFRNVSGTIQEVLGLPPEMPVFGVNFNRSYSPGLAPFPCCTIDAFRLGYEAVRILRDAPQHGTTRTYPYLFHDFPADRQERPEQGGRREEDTAVNCKPGRRTIRGCPPSAFNPEPRRKRSSNNRNHPPLTVNLQTGR